MTRTGRWRVAEPLWDVPAATGEAPAGEPPPPDSTDDSLDDHEASYGSSVRQPASDKPIEESKPAAEARERDETGKFTKPTEKPRHRAASQRASAEDVPRIAELTRRLREAEARAEAAERRGTTPREETPTERKPQPIATSDRFPKFEAWLQQPGNAEKDWDDWFEAAADHGFARRRAAERAEEARMASARELDEAERAYEDKIPAILKQYPDFADVMAEAPRVSKAIEHAVLAVGPEAAYYLATHPDEAEELTNETLVRPDEPGFKAVVASTKRYLQTLVASEQRPSSSSRTAAGSTGAALASVPRTAPKPPTPVRTGAPRREDAPDDDESLDDHERRYGSQKKRA